MNVALVKLTSLGDVIHALPVAAALRRTLPDARLLWVVERREGAVLRGGGAVDEIIETDMRTWRRARTLAAARAAARAARALWQRLAAARVDVAIDLQGLLKSGLVVAATRAPLRIGFAAGRCREPVSALLTNLHVTPPASAVHVVEQYLALTAPLGARAAPVEFPLGVDPAGEARIDDFFAAGGLKPRDPVVVLNPGAARPGKRWPTPRFRELGERLARDAGAVVVVAWGPGERADAELIASGQAPERVWLAPPTDLGALAALLRRASVVVAGDTGPLHLAAALGTPCVGLFGPTSAGRNGPYGDRHRVLTGPSGALDGVDVSAVYGAARDLLEER